MTPLDKLYHGAEADLLEAVAYLNRLARQLSAPPVGQRRLGKYDRENAAIELGRHARTISRVVDVINERN